MQIENGRTKNNLFFLNGNLKRDKQKVWYSWCAHRRIKGGENKFLISVLNEELMQGTAKDTWTIRGTKTGKQKGNRRGR